MAAYLVVLAAATAAASAPATSRRVALRSLVAAPLATQLAPPARAAAPPPSSVSKEVLSGLAGGAAQRIAKDVVLFPIDTVKVRLQTAGNRALTRRAFARPYSGVLAPLVVGVPAASLFFGVKDGLAAYARNAGVADEFALEALTVALANGPYWAARAPSELLKTRQQLAADPEGLASLARRIYDEAGLAGFYAGAVESYSYAVPADVVKFSAYRFLKQRYAAGGGDAVLRKALLGSAASAAANVFTTPLDVCKTRALEAGDGGRVSLPARAAAIARDEGVMELYAGIAPRVARAVVSGALQFGTYEWSKARFR